MKTRNLTSTVMKIAVATLLTFVLGTNVYGQVVRSQTHNFKKNAIESLIMGIKSENAGVKRDGIYFAGKYGIVETVDILVEELKNEKNPKNRILIALSLYMIGKEKGIDAILKTASTDQDKKVRKMCTAIVNEYNNSKNETSFFGTL